MTARNPVFARLYGWAAPLVERAGAGRQRARLLRRASGRVIEVGAGPGANFAHYPGAVTDVLAVEPEPALHRLAGRAAERAQIPVWVVDGVAERLPARSGAFDTAVSTLVLCTVPDPAVALAELHRVLRPGGRLLFWEHVRAEGAALAGVQRALDATVWPRLGGGCHVHRDTVGAIEAAGFVVAEVDRFRLPGRGAPLPLSPQALGVAIRP
jgi:SAM-dependent methyltransferase